jgi:hypothetical protein
VKPRPPLACIERAAVRGGCADRKCAHHCASLVPANRRASVTACRLLFSGPLTLDEIGRLLGVSRERIRQVEAVALKTLRRAALAAGLDWANLSPEARQGVPGWRAEGTTDDD